MLSQSRENLDHMHTLLRRPFFKEGLDGNKYRVIIDAHYALGIPCSFAVVTAMVVDLSARIVAWQSRGS